MKTKIFVEICLFGVIGMSDDEIIQLIGKLKDYRLLKTKSHR